MSNPLVWKLIDSRFTPGYFDLYGSEADALSAVELKMRGYCRVEGPMEAPYPVVFVHHWDNVDGGPQSIHSTYAGALVAAEARQKVEKFGYDYSIEVWELKP